MDEATLVRRACTGDRGAFDALLAPYMLRVYRLACLITHDPDSAGDAVQEALLRAYRALGNVRPGGAFYPWLARIVVNEAIKQARRRVKAVPLPADAAPPEGVVEESPEAILQTREEHRRIWGAIQRLSPAHRAAVVLRYYEELSEAEMAAVLDIPPGTVKSRLYHARAALEEMLGAPDPASPRPGLRPALHGGENHD